ncbi:protein PIF [Patella vulgata]|uniref:protein PIF n=1 Tax=Patella vulgata TaxID=6465 RepID=UPI00217FE10F|nr:protein PIF [Patella vulgata]
MNNLRIAFVILACLTVEINSEAITNCDSKDVMNGVGYKASPNSCRKFIQCQEADSTHNDTNNVLITAMEKDCGDSLFWNQQVKNCVRFPESDCYNGECDDATYLFESTSSCGAYFICTNASVSSGCCPESATAFDPIRKECVFSSTCEYKCNSNATESACSDIYKVHVMDSGKVNPCKYEVHESNHAPKIMSCGAGTNYDAEKCACLGGGETEPKPCPAEVCKPDFKLTFENNRIRDVAGGAWIQNVGQVSVTDESGNFNGNSRLAVVRFSNVDFGLPMAVKLRYLDTVNKDDMTVLSTGGDIDLPGLFIKAGNGRVTIGVLTVSANTNFELPLSSSATTTGINTWKEVVLYYNGLSLSGVVRSLDTFGSITPIEAVSVPDNVERSKILNLLLI